VVLIKEKISLNRVIWKFIKFDLKIIKKVIKIRKKWKID